MARLLIAAVAATALAMTAAYSGVDVSSAVYPSTWQCLKSNGYNFAVIRAFQSTGSPDPVGPHTVYNAWSGGMSYVDVYMFPCPSCGNPEGQVKSAIANLQNYNISSHSPYGPPHTFGTFWFDIEGPQYWSSNTDENIQFMQGLISAGQQLGLVLGVYTSESQWGPIMNNWSGASGLPLWYAHYDNNPSFSDFSPFAGWSKPAIKQYAGDASVCGADVDLNWY